MIHLSNIIIEVTRRCNIECGHCLRGEQEMVDMNMDYIRILTNQTESIGNVTFSGGEPSLPNGIRVMEEFLNACKVMGLPVDSFYIATNGTVISEAFVMFCLKMYSYCSEKDLCRIDVSNDLYHQDEMSYNTDLLDGLGFFRRKFEKEGYIYPSGSLIAQGRQHNGRNPHYVDITYTEDLLDADLYLNCKGQIINGCDWSYDNQDQHVICNVADLEEWDIPIKKEME